jgi:hypothetical protein
MKMPTKPTTAISILDPEVKEKALAALKTIDAEMGDNPKELVDTEQLYEIVNDLFPENATIPPKQSLDAEVKKHGIEIEYIDDDGTVSAGGLAYVYRAFNGSYRIFLNPQAIDNERLFMDIHEKGHVVYNHLEVGVNRDHFKKAIASQFKKVKDFFSDTTLKNKTEDDLVNYLYFKFANIAQDMEINSKQYSTDWDVAKQTMSRVAAEVHLDTAKTPKKQKQMIAGLIRELEGGDNPWFCHPENYPGLWHRMDWMFYMRYLVNHIEETVQKIAVASAGMSGEKTKEKGAGKGKIGEDDVDEAKGEENRGEQEFPDEEFETDDQFDKGNQGAGGAHNVAMIEPTNVGSIEELANIIQRLCYNYEKRYLHTDVLYNVNRNKHSGVVIPRRHYTRKVYPGAMQFVVDVSGSVHQKLVEACITTIKESVSFDKKRSHVICWDTGLCADFTLDGPIKIPRGGDNKCVRGIKYAIDNYIKRPDDKLIFISDYGDFLQEISDEAKRANCFRYSIGYSYDGSDPFEQDWSHMNAKQRQEYMKVFKCFNVNIDSKYN